MTGIARNHTALALTLAALALFAGAVGFPLIVLEAHGLRVDGTVLAAARALHEQQLSLLALVVLATGLLLPAAHLGGLIWWLLARNRPRTSPLHARVGRLLRAAVPWVGLDVLFAAALVTLAKLAGNLRALPGPGLPLLLGSVVLWHAVVPRARLPAGSESRRPPDAGRTAALLIAAAILFVPANLLPVLTTRTAFGARPDTILSGVARLWEMQARGLAVVVFIVSILVPALKILVLAALVLAAGRRSAWPPHRQRQLHRLVEWIGRWSMLDIFAMGLLAALVHSRVAGVEVNLGALAFAGVVLSTMWASASWNPSIIGMRTQGGNHAG